MNKKTITEIVKDIPNLSLRDIAKLAEILERFENEPDYKITGSVKTKIDVNTDEFDKKIEQSQKKVESLIESIQEMGLGAFSDAELWEEMEDRGLIKITQGR